MGRLIFRRHSTELLLAVLLTFGLVACAGGDSNDNATEQSPVRLGLVIDSGTEDDRGFNQSSLEGAESAATELGYDFTYLTSRSTNDYDAQIANLVQQEKDIIITVGFRMGDATSKAAQRHPDTTFIVVDNAFFPGSGCSEEVANCYTEEGGLENVTSLMFAEDQVAYLAGVLAACMSETGTIATVAGMEIPPVIRFVTGYNNGARSYDPEVETLYQYIPDFDDPETGEVVAQGFILEGADVIFGAGGNTGNGGLLAAHAADIMAIGVDVDQYFTFPEVQSALLTSASKRINVAVRNAILDYAAGNLQSGIRISTLENGGIGLAPFHDWEERIPQTCKDAVASAEETIIANPELTGFES